MALWTPGLLPAYMLAGVVFIPVYGVPGTNLRRVALQSAIRDSSRVFRARWRSCIIDTRQLRHFWMMLQYLLQGGDVGMFAARHATRPGSDQSPIDGRSRRAEPQGITFDVKGSGRRDSTSSLIVCCPRAAQGVRLPPGNYGVGAKQIRIPEIIFDVEP